MSSTTMHRLSAHEVEKMQGLLEVFHLAFETESTHANQAYLLNVLGQSHFWAYVFEENDQVIGGFTGFVLPSYYHVHAEFYIYDIAVHPLHQRKGVGRQLIEQLMEDASKNGISEVFVDASKEDVHALDFYESFKGSREEVVQFSFRHSK